MAQKKKKIEFILHMNNFQNMEIVIFKIQVHTT